MKIVKLTEQELAANRELLNIALKAGGLPVAAAALTLDRKLAAAKDAPPPKKKRQPAKPTVYEQPPEDGREYHAE